MLEMFSRVNVGKCDSWPIKYKADFPKSRLGSEEWLTFVNCHVLPPPPLEKKIKRGVPWWLSRLRIQHSHCSGWGHWGSVGWISARGTSACHSQKFF